MFDPVTAAFLRTAPSMPGLDPATLPQSLTARYAELVARRLRSAEGEPIGELNDGSWPLSRIADAYELITSIHDEPAVRRAAAFVAGTAQQILAQEASSGEAAPAAPILNRDRVDPSLAAPLLFLAAEQYADASEAARRIRLQGREQDHVVTLLAEGIRDLAAGKLAAILERRGRRPDHFTTSEDLEAAATAALYEAILVGVELFAAEILSEPVSWGRLGLFKNARAAFSRVVDLSTETKHADPLVLENLTTTYPGPRHLASLLIATYDATAMAATTKIDPPPGIDEAFWKKWLRHRAASTPFTWPNHRDAIAKGFHTIGRSAVMVLPTGAGKTTVSCLKIASTLAAGQNVVFIAPTHALVEQLTADLQEIFPEELLNSSVSNDFDQLFATGAALREIEVMTPERCLALLSYAPDAFADVGLLVFDECHLLNPISGLRRALDGMFCVLAFSSIAPSADLLFLSAMIRNGGEFSAWIGALTGRECVFVEPLWKPSRQARGVLVYERSSIDHVIREAVDTQSKKDISSRKPAKTLRSAAKKRLRVEPFALFGLQYNWLRIKEGRPDWSINSVSESAIHLGGELRGRRVIAKPNVNVVAAHIAASSARNNLKTIVFVNVKSHTISTAQKIAAELGDPPVPTPDEEERWQALALELGGLKHSLLAGPSTAVPHNSQMLRLERDLAERMFRRPDGAQVIVATPTLAQGLNLPAHLAILASDMRAGPDDGVREALAAHELLNAAARAGRAGHLANGVVLLVPEAILTFVRKRPLDADLVDKLRSILPEDDRCLDMSDPLEIVLDRIDAAAVADPDVEYALNRLSTAVALDGAETEAKTRYPIGNSFAGFLAARRETSEAFSDRIARLNDILSRRSAEAGDRLVLELSAQSGAPVSALQALKSRIVLDAAVLPATISDWVSWLFTWLCDDEASRIALLGREQRAILQATGAKADAALTREILAALQLGVQAWLAGKPLSAIETELGGDPDRHAACPRARHLITGVVPLGLTFVMGLLAGTAKELAATSGDGMTSTTVLDCLPAAVRRGFDMPAKLAFADVRKGLLSRVQIHRAFDAEVGHAPEIDSSSDYGTLVAAIRMLL
jgi:hypothetical protein